MSFNIGYLMAIKTNGIGGGALTLTEVSGSDGSAQRGLPERGTRVGVGSLPIFNPVAPTSPLNRPSCKFSSNGIAIIEFLYDYSAIPQTVSISRGRINVMATPCSYVIDGIRGNDLLINFMNLADFENTSPNFLTPSFPVPRIQSMIDEAATMARRLAAIINPLSRHVLAGVIVVR